VVDRRWYFGKGKRRVTPGAAEKPQTKKKKNLSRSTASGGRKKKTIKVQELIGAKVSKPVKLVPFRGCLRAAL